MSFSPLNNQTSPLSQTNCVTTPIIPPSRIPRRITSVASSALTHQTKASSQLTPQISITDTTEEPTYLDIASRRPLSAPASSTINSRSTGYSAPIYASLDDTAEIYSSTSSSRAESDYSLPSLIHIPNSRVTRSVSGPSHTRGRFEYNDQHQAQALESIELIINDLNNEPELRSYHKPKKRLTYLSRAIQGKMQKQTDRKTLAQYILIDETIKNNVIEYIQPKNISWLKKLRRHKEPTFDLLSSLCSEIEKQSPIQIPSFENRPPSRNRSNTTLSNASVNGASLNLEWEDFSSRATASTSPQYLSVAAGREKLRRNSDDPLPLPP